MSGWKHTTRAPARHWQYAVAGLALCLAQAGSGEPTALDYVQQSLMIGGRTETARIPAGYRLEVLAERLAQPRMLSFGTHGELFIGSRSGQIYKLLPPYREVTTLTRLRGYPHSVVQRGGKLFISRTDSLLSIEYVPGQTKLDADDSELVAAIPGGGGHNSRTLGVGPDNRLYVSLGIQGNCTPQLLDERLPFEHRRGGVMVLDETRDPPQWKPFAAGLRNPVGFDWHPETRVLYASNNGPDHLGYEVPPEYFAKLLPGSFHGMPWYQYDGERIRRDPCIRGETPYRVDEVALPAATFPARNAPMAVAFIPPGTMHKSVIGDAVVALRGSWGTSPTGSARGDLATRRHPKVVLVRFENGEAARVDDLVTGFQDENGKRWARPVGVAVGPDGSLYFTSDEEANALFRLSRIP